MYTAAADRVDHPYAFRIAALAVFYLAAAKASLLLAIPPGYATAVWPPSGIAFALLLIWGVRAWPGIWLGAALANFSVGASAPIALAIATGNTLEGLFAAWAARRLLAWEFGFRQPETVFMFAAIAAASSVIAATFGVSALCLSGAMPLEQYFANWYTWWQGDTTGIILIVPLVLAWSRASAPDERRPDRAELAIFWGLLAATLASVFGGMPGSEVAAAVEFLLIPFMAWAGCRFSERQVTLVVIAAAGTAIWSAIDGRGPYRLLTLNESLLVLQAFTSTLALMALVLYAATQRRAEATRILRTSRDHLQKAVHNRNSEVRDINECLEQTQALAHIGSWSWDLSSGRVSLSNELQRICGVDPQPGDPSLAAVLERLSPEDRLRVKRAVDRALGDRRPWDFNVRLVRPDGEVRVLRSLGEMLVNQTGEAQRLRGTFVDLTEPLRVKQLEASHHDIAAHLARAPSVADGLGGALRIVCQVLRWDAGFYWEIDRATNAWQPALAWHVQAPAVAEFAARSKALVPALDRGLAARALRDERPVWIDDLAHEPLDARATVARVAGLRAAFAFPVIAGGKVLGVMEFFGAGPRRPEPELCDMAAPLGGLLGEFVLRARSEHRLKEAVERIDGMLRRLVA